MKANTDSKPVVLLGSGEDAAVDADVVRNAGLRSDGELVQASRDSFDFSAAASRPTADEDHKKWIELLSVGQTVDDDVPADLGLVESADLAGVHDAYQADDFGVA